MYSVNIIQIVCRLTGNRCLRTNKISQSFEIPDFIQDFLKLQKIAICLVCQESFLLQIQNHFSYRWHNLCQGCSRHFFAGAISFAKYCSIISGWKRSLQRMMLWCLKKGAWIMTLFWRHRCTVGLVRGADSQIGTLFKCTFFCSSTHDLLSISPSYSLFWSCQWQRWFALTFSCFIAEL